MKYYMSVMLPLLFFSCVVTQTESKATKFTLKGTWEVTEVKFIGDSGLYDVDLFDLVQADCFKGSEWVLIPDNGSGKLTILNSDLCENKIQKIHWSLHEPGDGSFQFQFKYIDLAENESMNSNRGYLSKIKNLNSTSMIMNVNQKINDKPYEIEMTLNKISDEIVL